jgi:nucleotide-binding universal stress UspA family protein
VKRIVLAANAEAEQPWVADAVAQLARETGADVAVMCADELETEMLSTLPRDVPRDRAERAAVKAEERLRAAGVEASHHVMAGPALQAILDFADQQQADLIVVGSSTRSRVAQRILGSTPLALVQRSSRPVMVVTEPHAS